MKKETSSCCGAPNKVVDGDRVCCLCGEVTTVVFVEVDARPSHHEELLLVEIAGEANEFVKGHIEPMTKAEVAFLNEERERKK